MSPPLLTPVPPPAAGKQPIATLGRRYHFCASHRLHSDRYDEPTNRAIFGKCNNPHGHGHNYTVELLFRGPVDPTTGMVADLAALDEFALTHLLHPFNHQNLNTLPCFSRSVPSTENLAVEIHRIFRHFSPARLVSVHVQETSNNSFTYAGPTSVTPTIAHSAASPAASPVASPATPEQGTDLVTGEDSHSGAL